MPRVLDYIVLGAGPGGLQLGYYLQRAGMDYLILEGGPSVASFFREFPRHRTLLSINKRFTGSDDPELNLRWDWNSLLAEPSARRLSSYTSAYFPDADDLVRYLEDYAVDHALAIECDARIERVDRNSDGFALEDRRGRRYQARRLIVATGPSRPYIPQIPGIELAEGYSSYAIDPRGFDGQRVLILGKGNTAFEVANSLLGAAASIHLCSPHSVRLAWRTHYVGNLRAINTPLLDSYQLKSQNAVLDADLLRLTAREGARGVEFVASFAYRHADGEREELVYDRVITCTGWRFDDSIYVDGARPELTCGSDASGGGPGRYPAMTPAFESTNVPGLYFAGAITASRAHHRATSAFIHGFRYTAAALYRVLRARYHAEPWPARQVAARSDALTDAILSRVNRSSSMWQQFGYIGDVVALTPAGARYYEDVPIELARAGGLPLAGPYLTVTLEYGARAHLDPFGSERVRRDDVGRAADSQFLHPIIRRCDIRGEVIDEHHIIEDLAAEWREPEHVEPLRQFLTRTLDAALCPLECHAKPC